MINGMAGKGIIKQRKFVKDTSQTSLDVGNIDVKLVNTLNPRKMKNGGVSPINMQRIDLEGPRTAESPTRLAP